MTEWLQAWSELHRLGLTEAAVIAVLWWFNARIEALEDAPCDD